MTISPSHHTNDPTKYVWPLTIDGANLLLFRRWLKTFGATDDFFDRTLIRREKINAGS